jgi:hypothetical protein
VKERGHLEDLSIDGRIILNVSYGGGMIRHRWDSFGRGQEQVVGCCEHGNEPSDSVCGEFIYYVRTCWLHKMDSSPWSWLVGWISELTN